jgi:hypothetical protein
MKAAIGWEVSPFTLWRNPVTKSEKPVNVFIILNEPIFQHCHSEFAFGRGGIPATISWVGVFENVRMIKYDQNN